MIFTRLQMTKFQSIASDVATVTPVSPSEAHVRLLKDGTSFATG